MVNKRNAALEALQGAGFKSPVEAPLPAEDTTETVVKIPARRGKQAKGVRRVMVYMPAKVARKFREVAFTEERKANDVYLEALDLYLTKHGHGGIRSVVER